MSRRCDFDPGGPLRATPLLVAEIVTPHGQSQDRVLKRAQYEALGVRACWIIGPATPSLTELRLAGRRYTERTIVEGDARFTTDYPFPVELTLAALTWRG